MASPKRQGAVGPFPKKTFDHDQLDHLSASHGSALTFMSSFCKEKHGAVLLYLYDRQEALHGLIGEHRSVVDSHNDLWRWRGDCKVTMR